MDCYDFDYCFKCKHSSEKTHPGHIFIINPTHLEKYPPYCDGCSMVGNPLIKVVLLLANVGRTCMSHATSVSTVETLTIASNVNRHRMRLIRDIDSSRTQRLTSFESFGVTSKRRELWNSILQLK